MRIRVYATLRDLIGTNEIEINVDGGTTVRQLLQELAERYPTLGKKLWNADGSLTGFVRVLINGRLLEYLDGLDTVVKEDDEVSLFPPVGGGR